MDTLPVTLIVKAPNNANHEDQTVKCELSWTIRRLKGHLAEVYPCKPEEQKLIYSGQLLQDAVVLKDVLRQYDGQETHTVHLVYTPKQQQHQTSSSSSRMATKDSAPVPAGSSGSGSSSNAHNVSGGDSSSSVSNNSSSGDGLRRRHVQSSSQAAASSPSSTPAPSASSIGVRTSPGGLQMPFNLQASALYSAAPMNLPAMPTGSTAQMAMYQQWYQQYMHQYMAYTVALQQQQQLLQQQQQQTNQNQSQMPWPMPNYINQLPGGAGQLGGHVENAAEVVAPANNAPGEAVADGPAQAGVVQQQPRFPLLVHEPDRPEPDWLDHVNMICRVSVLLLMIYFYSSALRFAIVMCAILAIFLYRNRVALLGHNNIINRRAAVQPQRNVNVAPAGAGAAPVVEQQRQGNEGGELVGDGEGNRVNPDNNNNLDVANRNVGELAATTDGAGAEQNNPTTVLSFLRTFVTSFFYSLLPEPAIAP